MFSQKLCDQLRKHWNVKTLLISIESLEWPRRSLRSTIWRSLRNFTLMMYYRKKVPFISYNTLWLGLLMISQNSKSALMQFIFLNWKLHHILRFLGLKMISQNSKSTLQKQKESTQSHSLLYENISTVFALLMFSLFSLVCAFFAK